MALSRDTFEDTLDVARDYLQGRSTDDEVIVRDFAEALVQLSSSCVVGLPCEEHGGVVHGQEAEELRAGVEQILHNTAVCNDDEASFVLAELRRSLIFLLDHIDARDSLLFREATDPQMSDDDVSTGEVPA